MFALALHKFPFYGTTIEDVINKISILLGNAFLAAAPAVAVPHFVWHPLMLITVVTIRCVASIRAFAAFETRAPRPLN